VATPGEATASADVIVTATNSPTPVLMSEHLRPGQHIAAIGIRSEIAPDAIARCRVIADGHHEALYDGKFSTGVAAGLLDESDLGPDLGAVLAGLAHGRTSDDEITLFDSSGVAIQDVVCARFAWERAQESDAGTLVTFTDRGVLD
jgi:ornithine cyclodeaminase/alanine dehydrogenase